MKFTLLFIIVGIILCSLVNATPYEDCSTYGTCKPESISTYSNITNINNTYINQTVNATVNTTQFDSNNPIHIKESWLTNFIENIVESYNYLTETQADTLYCKLTGCTMNGNINLNNYNITNATFLNNKNVSQIVTGNMSSETTYQSTNTTISTTNYSLKFDGTNDFIDTGVTDLPLTDLTISFWAKSYRTSENASAYGNRIIGYEDSTSGENGLGIYFYPYNQAYIILREYGSNYDMSFGTINPNEWYMYTITISSVDGTTIYKNGNSVNSNSYAYGFSSASQSLHFGSSGDGNSFFAGDIDEILVFSRSISPGEVSQIYNSGVGTYTNVSVAPFNNGLLYAYNLDEGSGNIAIDLMNNKNGTIYGGAIYEDGKVSHNLTITTNTTVLGAKGLMPYVSATNFISTDNALQWNDATNTLLNIWNTITTIGNDTNRVNINAWNVDSNNGTFTNNLTLNGSNVLNNLNDSLGDSFTYVNGSTGYINMTSFDTRYMSGGYKSFYFTNHSSDVAGMYNTTLNLEDIHLTGSQITVTAQDGITTIAQFISHPDKTYAVASGTRFFHLDAKVSNIVKPTQLRGLIYRTNLTGGNQILLRNSTLSIPLTETQAEYTITAVGEDLLINSSERILFVIQSEKEAGGALPDVTLYLEDETLSRLDVPSPVGVTDISGLVPYTGATSNVDLNGKNINNASSYIVNSTNPNVTRLTNLPITSYTSGNGTNYVINNLNPSSSIIKAIPELLNDGGTIRNISVNNYYIKFNNGTLNGKSYKVNKIMILPGGDFDIALGFNILSNLTGIANGNIVNLISSNNVTLSKVSYIDTMTIDRTLYVNDLQIPSLAISGIPTNTNPSILESIITTGNSIGTNAIYNVYGSSSPNIISNAGSVWNYFMSTTIPAGNNSLNTLGGISSNTYLASGSTTWNGTLTNLYGISSTIGLTRVLGNTKNAYSYYASAVTAKNTSNLYGLYIGSQSGASNKSYSIYTNLGKNRFGDDTIIEADSKKLIFGAGSDSSIYYDGTDMIINPKEVGSGSLKVLGNLNASGYNVTATDFYSGTSKGLTQSFNMTNASLVSCQMNFTGGILTASNC